MSLAYAEWLTRQRWYAGRGRHIASAVPRTVTALDPDLDHVLLDVAYTDGSSDTYQVLVGWDLELLPEYVVAATIGAVGGRTAVDALYDDGAARRLLGLIAADAIRDDVRFLPEPDATIDIAAPPRVSEAEQSNTSVIYDSTMILKLFRRVLPGLNPDLELSQVLARFGSPHVPRLLGAIESTAPDGQPLSLATLTAFAPNSGDGWAMATASARDFLAADPDLPVGDAGGDFAAEAERLGEACAAVHATLAEALGTAPGRPPLERMAARFDAAVAQVPGLAEWTDDVHRVYEAADRITEIQRIHGDLHLGQVLRTQDTWLLIDFEGEPGSPVDERRAPDSPLRDVAGMLRSFDYASHQLLVDSPDDEALAARAAAWSRHNTDAFYDGYAAVAGYDPRDQSELLRAYEIDKLVYEATYESRYRPGWAWIPMRTFDRVLRPVGGPPLPRSVT